MVRHPLSPRLLLSRLGAALLMISIASIARAVTFDVSPDGQTVVFSSTSGDELYLLDLNTNQVRRLTDTPEKEGAPAFSPDGQTIAYCARDERSHRSSILIRPREGGEARRVTDDAACSDAVPSFSSDGKQIVFARAHRYRPYSMGGWTWDDWDVYLIGSDGTGLRRLTRQKYYGVGRSRFAPDGKRVFYSAMRHGLLTSTLFQVDVAGQGQPTLLLDEVPENYRGGAWGSEPVVSPDGRSIAFISDRLKPYSYDILITPVEANQPNPLRVTRISGYNQNPVFTADSTILFLAGTKSDWGGRPIFSLWQVNADGSGARRLADSDLFAHPLRWRSNNSLRD